MLLKSFFAGLLFLAAAPPLPDLRIEATDGGSVLLVKNTYSQPLTAYLVELVDYPGSYFQFWDDQAGKEPIAPGAEKRMPIANMTVGAAPDYVKMRAAVYADGTSAGIPEKVDLILSTRRERLQTARELLSRISKGESSANLREWASSIPEPERVRRYSNAAIRSMLTKELILKTAERLDSASSAQAVEVLKAIERQLAASKPPL